MLGDIKNDEETINDLLNNKYNLKNIKILNIFNSIFKKSYSIKDVKDIIFRISDKHLKAEKRIVTLVNVKESLVTDITNLKLEKELMYNENKKLFLENDNLKIDTTLIENKYNNLLVKHKCEINKLAATLDDYTHKKIALETEVIALRKDLDEYRSKISKEQKANINESTKFLNKIMTSNEKLVKDNKRMTEELKKLKPRVK